MSSNPTRKTGKKNRKFGRGMRKPAHARYVAENRREKTKHVKLLKLPKCLQRKKQEKKKLFNQTQDG